MAHLMHTVAVGRVRYPAGTTETPELRELIDPKHWSDGESTASSSPAAQTFDPALVEELEQARQLAAAEIEKRDQRIAELEADLGQLKTATPPAADEPQTKPPALAVDPYEGKSNKDLKAEVDRRNDSRSADAYIQVELPGNKPQLLAALQADDAAHG